MTDFDPHVCRYCGKGFDAHKPSRKGGTMFYCDNGDTIYWTHAQDRKIDAEARRKFVSEGLLQAARGGRTLDGLAAELGRTWDQLDAECRRYFREWRPQ